MNKTYTLVILLSLVTYVSFACSCYDVSVRKALKQSETAFIGKVVKVTKNDFIEKYPKKDGTVYKFEYSLYDFEFEITEVFKGTIENKTIRITTSGDEGDCGGYYLENESYLIYAYTTDNNPYFDKKSKVKPYLTTDICIGSELITELEPKRLKKLKRYKKRKE